MKRTTKFRIFADLQKEEQFINKMNQRGWKLEYVQFGCFYTFLPSEPDEYFTILCATDKPKILQMTSAAVLSGYESIPHTYDGIANVLYLSGRKDSVDSEFFNDNQNKLNHYKNIKKIYGYQTSLILFFGLLLLVPLMITVQPLTNILRNLGSFCDEHLASALSPVILVLALSVLGLSYIIIALYIFRLYLKTRKQYNSLDADMNLYE